MDVWSRYLYVFVDIFCEYILISARYEIFMNHVKSIETSQFQASRVVSCVYFGCPISPSVDGSVVPCGYGFRS